MNHIQFYESIINDYSTDTELRVYMRSFYQMPLKLAMENIEQIKLMLDMKLNDYMKSE